MLGWRRQMLAQQHQIIAPKDATMHPRRRLRDNSTTQGSRIVRQRGGKRAGRSASVQVQRREHATTGSNPLPTKVKTRRQTQPAVVHNAPQQLQADIQAASAASVQAAWARRMGGQLVLSDQSTTKGRQKRVQMRKSRSHAGVSGRQGDAIHARDRSRSPIVVPQQLEQVIAASPVRADPNQVAASVLARKQATHAKQSHQDVPRPAGVPMKSVLGDLHAFLDKRSAATSFAFQPRAEAGSEHSNPLVEPTAPSSEGFVALLRHDGVCLTKLVMWGQTRS